MKRILFIALLAFAGPVLAADSQSVYRVPGDSLIGESDDAAGDPVLFDVITGVTNDTGTERCAQVGMDCVDTYVVDPAGAAGDELTDAACADDVADAAIVLTFCN